MKLGDLARQFRFDHVGDADTEITGVAPLQAAGPGQLTFLFNPSYRSRLATTRASAVVLTRDQLGECSLPCLVTDNPRLAWANIAGLFDPAPGPVPSIHPSAIIADTATIGEGVGIDAGVVVKPGAEVRDGVVIGSGCHVGDRAVVGAGTRLFPNVVLYHDVHIGESCLVHAAAVLGADGFGFEFDKATGNYVKIPQIYGVRVGNHVEIGAGTTIDRGGLNHTSVGDHCKLDNQVQIGHGTSIGHHTVISGCTAIGGSTSVGSYCLIGGAAGIVDNVRIADQVEITAMTLVSRSIHDRGRYSSGTGLMRGQAWKRSLVGFKKLDDILKRLRRLESSVGQTGADI